LSLPAAFALPAAFGVPWGTSRSEQYWRARAVEARAQAESLTLPSARKSLLQIADIYDQLARQAAQREKPQNKG
jgi:hypothetical protein